MRPPLPVEAGDDVRQQLGGRLVTRRAQGVQRPQHPPVAGDVRLAPQALRQVVTSALVEVRLAGHPGRQEAPDGIALPDPPEDPVNQRRHPVHGRQ